VSNYAARGDVFREAAGLDEQAALAKALFQVSGRFGPSGVTVQQIHELSFRRAAAQGWYRFKRTRLCNTLGVGRGLIRVSAAGAAMTPLRPACSAA
jgi:hypothetical protein